MQYRGATIVCLDRQNLERCEVFLGQVPNQQFENLAAAQAFVDRVLDLDDDGYPD